MNALTYLNSLRPALPFSTEKPCTEVSNSEIRRWLQQGSVLFNHEKVEWNEEIDFTIFSLVFFPKGKRRTTLI